MPRLKLSIVTPSYNTARYLRPAIQSVIDQDWPETEYWVMDGGSTDGSVDVLKSFGDRVRWVSEKDKGQSDAINKGFARSSGDVFSWLNSDDTYAPGAFRAAMEFLEQHPEIDMVYGDANYIDIQGGLISKCVHIEPYSRHRLFYYSDFIVQPATFFRRRAFEAVGGVDTSIHWAMDYDLWLKIARQFKIAYLPRLLANFRWLADNKTATGGFGRLNEIEQIVARQGLALPAYNRLERVNLHLQNARQALTRLNLSGTIASTARATGNLLSSPRAVLSLFQPLTWKIIWTGQVLRKRAIRSDQELLKKEREAASQKPEAGGA
jgi:glycosyltransferase involved in cell wall biosynthesis